MNRKPDRPQPLPNETVTIYGQTATVIASVVAEDAPGYLALALMPTTPYHVVAYVDLAHNTTVLDRPHDIVAAVEAYEQHGASTSAAQAE